MEIGNIHFQRTFNHDYAIFGPKNQNICVIFFCKNIIVPFRVVSESLLLCLNPLTTYQYNKNSFKSDVRKTKIYLSVSGSIGLGK